MKCCARTRSISTIRSTQIICSQIIPTKEHSKKSKLSTTKNSTIVVSKRFFQSLFFSKLPPIEMADSHNIWSLENLCVNFGDIHVC